VDDEVHEEQGIGAEAEDESRKFVDAHTGLLCEGAVGSIRDKPGHELWVEAAKAERDKLTRAEFCERMQNPSFYTIVDKGSKRNFAPHGDTGLVDLHFAVFDGDKNSVLRLQLAGISPDLTDKCDRTALMYAAVEGQTEIVSTLVRNKCDVNAQDKYGLTALHYAVMYHRLDIAELLITQSAIVDVRDSWGDTPLWRAVCERDVELAKLLLANGADRHVKNKYGVAPWDLP
jgi:uncharacterized protein